jgi:CheY-like chemotaxis protein/two-component sensor histidine kinase
MSHELRTPLNNLLILAQMLAENSEKTLTMKQVKYAETIHSSGTDLLALINDILDLSKIESGKMDVQIGSVRFHELRDFCSKTFRHVADGKGLEFSIELGESLPSDTIITDAKRLQQVLKNLLSNALKFTEHGSVCLKLGKATGGWSANHAILSRAKSVIAFSVTDTGIGIPFDKQRIIFEAFQQADGTTSRKYGGTGLGLSISRELTRLLGGEIRLQSATGTGSTFTLYLPQTYVAVASMAKAELHWTKPVNEGPRPPAALLGEGTEGQEVDFILPTPSPAPAALVHEIEIDDDRNLIQPRDAVLLIVEDDVTFARILLDLAHDRGIKALVALRGSAALALAREFSPGAITLDITLPDILGWTILDRLKHDPATRHIPVHIISGDENRRLGLALGAMTYLEKTMTTENLTAAFDTIYHSLERRLKKLLVVTAQAPGETDWQAALGGTDVETIVVGSGGEALAAVTHQYLDALVVDFGLADIPAMQLVEEIHAEMSPLAPPIVVYCPQPVRLEMETAIRNLGRLGVVRFADATDRLLEETVLLLHRAEADLTEAQRQSLAETRRHEATLRGKKVLVVDDDVRNIFALTSVLEQHDLEVVHAENGRAGIEMLLKTPGIDGVLMDIMMPEMDGYETMRAIRKIPEFRTLPIFAVTAKAMKGDRAKCIEAGASDYITKPVDLEQLFSVLRVWLTRGAGVPRLESPQNAMTLVRQ